MSLFKEKSDALKDLEVIRQKRIAADQKVAEYLVLYREEYNYNPESGNSHNMKKQYNLLLADQIKVQKEFNNCKLKNDNLTEQVKKEYLKIVNDHYDKNFKKNIIVSFQLLKSTEHEENEYLKDMHNKYGSEIENPRKHAYYRVIKLLKQLFVIE